MGCYCERVFIALWIMQTGKGTPQNCAVAAAAADSVCNVYTQIEAGLDLPVCLASFHPVLVLDPLNPTLVYFLSFQNTMGSDIHWTCECLVPYLGRGSVFI